MKRISIKYYVLSIMVMLALYIIHTTSYIIPITLAQTPCGSPNPLRAQGLVSTPSFPPTSKFSTTGGCVIDPKVAFLPAKVPTYADLKSRYYDQTKGNKIPISGDATQSNLTATLDSVYYITGNLNISGNPSATASLMLVFIDGNLNFSSISYTWGGPKSGTVFIVKGNVNIDPLISQVDAVIISEGTICTAADFTNFPASQPTCPAANVATASALTINGSLISLTDTAPIKFRRTLADNSCAACAAEKINHQVKYLVLLRNLYSNTLQKWSEI